MSAGNCVLIVFLFSTLLAAPNPIGAQELKGQQSFAATVWGDVQYIFTSPSRIRLSDGIKLLTIATTATGFITLFDKHIDHDFIERDDFYVKPAIGLAKVGDAYDRISSKFVLLGLSAPMIAGGIAFKDKKLLETTRLMAESFLIAGAITYTGKRLFGRARPYTEQGPSQFDPFKFNAKLEHRSFPSGHATSAFSMMTVLAKQYDQWWVKIPAYTLALSVAFQRLDSRSHWGADVFAGGIIGYWVGNTLVSRYKRQNDNARVHPYIFGNRVGVIIGLQ